MATFTNAPWSSPESALDATDFCAVCLIDTNGSGEQKVKAKCSLPVQSTPSGPYNKNALRNAAARLSQVKGASPEERRAAARKLVRLMREAEMEPGDMLMQMAGMM